MIAREVVRRLQAFKEGRPLPRGSTRHFAVVPDEGILVLAFVRTGGESRPWGLAYGHPGEEPTILTVPEGRNRDLVSDMVAEFAPVLLGHLRSPGYVAHDPASADDLAPLRQVWLPNRTHLDMLHHLAYAYTFTQWGAGARGRLNALGRACGWLFREAQRPGQQHVMVATEALRESFTFPAQDGRQGHLGFLLAWLEGGDREARIRAATEAERHSMATSLDPSLERDELEELVDAWHGARDREDEREMAALDRRIGEILSAEFRRRFELTARTIDVLRADPRPVNGGVEILVKGALEEQWYQYTRMELRHHSPDDGPAFVPSPETDRHPAAAASRYLVHVASEDLRHSALLHDDEEMQAEAVARGDAFRGAIVDVRDKGEGRKTRPIWRIVDPNLGPLRLKIGSWVCVVGMAKRTGEIRLIEDQEDGTRLFEVEITGWKTKPNRAADPALQGSEVTLVATSAEGISRRKSQLVWRRDVPGAWLTLARPAGRRMVVDREAEESLETIERGIGHV